MTPQQQAQYRALSGGPSGKKGRLDAGGVQQPPAWDWRATQAELERRSLLPANQGRIGKGDTGQPYIAARGPLLDRKRTIQKGAQSTFKQRARRYGDDEVRGA